MKSSITSKTTDQEIIIKVAGRFDFNLHSQFKSVCDVTDAELTNKQFIIDLGKTEYLDSSALGMLLVLREVVTAKSELKIKITNSTPQIKTVLEVANFHTDLFDVL
jgi:HptB-dependent secretion and biofilm anti anti-sigma factor